MTCKGLLTYLGVEVIVFHTSFRAQMGTFYLSLHGFVFQKSSSRFTENICTILNARALTAWRRKLDVTKESSCASVTNKFHSGKLCSAPPTKFFPYADAEKCPKQSLQPTKTSFIDERSVTKCFWLYLLKKKCPGGLYFCLCRVSLRFTLYLGLPWPVLKRFILVPSFLHLMDHRSCKITVVN